MFYTEGIDRAQTGNSAYVELFFQYVVRVTCD